MQHIVQCAAVSLSRPRQYNTHIKMAFGGTTVKGGFQFTYNSKADYLNNATLPGFEFTFKVMHPHKLRTLIDSVGALQLLRESGNDWDVKLVRNGLVFLSYLESTFPLALQWTRCNGAEPHQQIVRR